MNYDTNYICSPTTAKIRQIIIIPWTFFGKMLKLFLDSVVLVVNNTNSMVPLYKRLFVVCENREWVVQYFMLFNCILVPNM